MIKFKKVIGEGFGSLITRTEFKLDRPGLNIVIGDTGHGKTTFFSLVRWVLYGVSLKETKAIGTWEHLRPEGYQGTLGRLIFKKDSVRYEIIRTLDYTGKIENQKLKNGIMILADGKPYIGRNKADKQEQINKILGYTNDLFVNATIFGQSMKRLIDQTGPGKKKIFEEAFEAGFIEEGKIKASSDLKIKVAELHEADKKLIIAKKDLEAINDKIEFTAKAKKDFIKENTQAKVRNAIKIVDLNKKIAAEEPKLLYIPIIKQKLDEEREELARLDYAKAESLEKEYNLLHTQVDEANKLIDFQRIKIKELNTKIKSVPTICSECDQRLDPRAVKKVIKGLKAQVERIEELMVQSIKRRDEVQVAFKRKNKELASIIHRKRNRLEQKESVEKLETSLESHLDTQNQIKRWQEQVVEYQKDIEHLINQKPTFKVKPLLKQKKEIKGQYRKIKELHKSIATHVETLKWVVGEALGNKGLKSYIFDTSLKNLNHRLTYYEQFIGYRIEFRVDLESASKDIFAVCYQGENLIYYEDLSGGQKQQVNICTAFAMNDMVSEGKPINILVFDEVFENLDKKCTDLVYDLIKEKAQHKCLFLISHNIDLQNSGDKVIRIRQDSSGQTHTKWI
jgi:DNA repair exonuclease SbcCD ATPase subunit